MASPNFSSPAAAFSRQAQLELTFTRSLERAARRFLDTLTYLLTEKPGMSPPSPVGLSNMWAEELGRVARDLRLQENGEQAAMYLLDDEAVLGFTDAVYETLLEVYAAAAQQGVSPSPAIHAALRPDSPPLALTASIWDQLADTGSSWMSRIRRTARTASTGMSGYLTQAGLQALSPLTSSISYPNKRWVTRRDDNVRSSHAAADGQTVPLNQAFQVGGVGLQYPGERGAPYEEIVNCRCVMVGAA